jgi:hypothetical protein
MSDVFSREAKRRFSGCIFVGCRWRETEIQRQRYRDRETKRQRYRDRDVEM